MGANICEKDCWKCELEGCPYTLEVSDKIENDIRFERLRVKAIDKSRYARYRATPRGRKLMIEAKNRYEKRNAEKVALWQFKSHYKRKNGVAPSEEECNEWVSRRNKLKQA